MIILSSPSGAGKTTLVKLISERKGFVTSISHTTRTPRSNEVDGKDYYFVNDEKFEEMIIWFWLIISFKIIYSLIKNFASSAPACVLIGLRIINT